MLSPIFQLYTPPSLGLKASAFTIHGLRNHRWSPILLARLHELRQSVDVQASMRWVDSFNRLRQRQGRSAKRFPASPCALLDQLLRLGELRRISPVVDLYNHWSLSTGLSIGAHDLRHIALPVRLDISQGHEHFHPLGAQQSMTLAEGEYAYFDANQQVICRMDYRQCAVSALQAESQEALFIVQGHPDTSSVELQQCVHGLKADLTRLCSNLNPTQSACSQD